MLHPPEDPLYLNLLLRRRDEGRTWHAPVVAPGYGWNGVECAGLTDLGRAGDAQPMAVRLVDPGRGEGIRADQGASLIPNSCWPRHLASAEHETPRALDVARPSG